MMSAEDLDNNLAASLGGDWLAQRKLIHYFKLEERLFKNTDPQKTAQKKACFDFFTNAANNRDPNAIAFLGELYHEGIGIEKDKNRSLELFRSAAEKYNNPLGQYLLGRYYWVDGPQKDHARALELLRQGARQGHAGARGALGRFLDSGDEKDRNKQQALEQGDPDTLNANCCPSEYGNPFGLYVPANRDIKITWREVTSADSIQNNKVVYKTDANLVTIEYVGAVPITNTKVIDNEVLDFSWSAAYRESGYKAKNSKCNTFGLVIACLFVPPCMALTSIPYCQEYGCIDAFKVMCKDTDDRTRVAHSIASVEWERSLSELIRKADRTITNRISGVMQFANNQNQPVSVNTDPRRSSQAVPPQQYGGENRPLLSEDKSIAPPPSYRPFEVEERQNENVVHVQGGATLRMGGSKK